jgi:hypothetical protein
MTEKQLTEACVRLMAAMIASGIEPVRHHDETDADTLARYAVQYAKALDRELRKG